MPAIDDVRQALSRSDFESAATTAVIEWRRSRSPVVGEVIDWLDDKFCHASPKLDAEWFQPQWLAEAERQETAESVGWLAQTLRLRVPEDEQIDYYASYAERTVVRHGALRARLEALLEMAADPRLAGAALEILWAGKLNTEQVHIDCSEIVVRHGDVRHAQQLQALIDQPRARASYLRTLIANLSRKAVAKLEALERSEDDDHEWAELLPKKASIRDASKQAAELVESVLASPYDEELRAVCADRLQELGDPRGEFIALQMLSRPSREAKQRMSALEKQHREEWLGPNLSLAFKSVRFRDGFPAIATLSSSHEVDDDVWEQALTDPRLATLERINRGRAQVWRHKQFLEALEEFEEEEAEEEEFEEEEAEV
jgi:uncharacterized protein (TIGR02996 family)